MVWKFEIFIKDVYEDNLREYLIKLNSLFSINFKNQLLNMISIYLRLTHE